MRRIETLIVLLALGFYAWFLHRFGWADVLHYVRVAGWGLLLTVALEADRAPGQHARMAGDDRALPPPARFGPIVRGADRRRSCRLRNSVGAARRPVRDGDDGAAQAAHGRRIGDGGSRGAGRDAGPGGVHHRRDADGAALRGPVPSSAVAGAGRPRTRDRTGRGLSSTSRPNAHSRICGARRRIWTSLVSPTTRCATRPPKPMRC